MARIDIRAGLGFRALNCLKDPTYIVAFAVVIDLAILAMFFLLARANRRGLRFADMATQALRRDSIALKQLNIDLDAAREEAETVGAMSHEVHTPLTAISGILMLLDRAKLPSAQDNLIQAGKVASERLLTLLTNVLDLTKLEANSVTLWERKVDLELLMEQWQKALSKRVANRCRWK